MVDISPAVVKNMRGVVYHKENLNVSEYMKYLKKAFRYRILGIHRMLAKDTGKPFVPLDCPISIKEPETVDKIAFESLIIALYYVSPLIILGPESKFDLEPFKIFAIKTSVQENERMKKLHLRVCDYSMIDWYSKLVELGKRGAYEKRLELVKKDGEQRFWRLKPYKGKERIVYYDLSVKLPNLPHESLYNIAVGYVLEL